MAGASAIYEGFLRVGKQKKVCTACNRAMDDHELIVFEKHVRIPYLYRNADKLSFFQLKDQMKKNSPEAVAANKAELKDWVVELERLQGLLPVEASLIRLKSVELPALEQQIKEQESLIPGISDTAEKVHFHS